jgi:hypothetical protein
LHSTTNSTMYPSLTCLNQKSMALVHLLSKDLNRVSTS